MDDTEELGDSDTATGTGISYRGEQARVPCFTCDRNSLFNSTMRFISSSADILFTGSAVYIFCLLSAPNRPASDVTFFIDGNFAGFFNQSDHPELLRADASEIYNYPIYSNSNLSSTRHNLTVAVGLRSPQYSGFLGLDYVIYSTEDDAISTESFPSSEPSPTLASSAAPTESSSSRTSRTAHLKLPMAAVAGIAVAAVVVVLAMTVLVLYHLRRRRRRRNSKVIIASPYGLTSSTTPLDSQPTATSISTSFNLEKGGTRRASLGNLSYTTPQSQALSVPSSAQPQLAVALAEVDRLRAELVRVNAPDPSDTPSLPPPAYSDAPRKYVYDATRQS